MRREVANSLMVVLWPSFLIATIAVGIVFSLIDPHDLVIHNSHVPEDRITVYTLGFVIAWLLSAAGCWMTHLLDRRNEHQVENVESLY